MKCKTGRYNRYFAGNLFNQGYVQDGVVSRENLGLLEMN